MSKSYLLFPLVVSSYIFLTLVVALSFHLKIGPASSRQLVDDDNADDVDDFNYDDYYQPVLSSRCGRDKVVASLSASGNPLLNCRSSQCCSSSTLDQ